jgi:hypothetical protein
MTRTEAPDVNMPLKAFNETIGGLKVNVKIYRSAGPYPWHVEEYVGKVSRQPESPTVDMVPLKRLPNGTFLCYHFAEAIRQLEVQKMDTGLGEPLEQAMRELERLTSWFEGEWCILHARLKINGAARFNAQTPCFPSDREDELSHNIWLKANSLVAAYYDAANQRQQPPAGTVP